MFYIEHMVRQKKKITRVSANPTRLYFFVPTLKFLAIFEQALLKSECVPCRN